MAENLLAAMMTPISGGKKAGGGGGGIGARATDYIDEPDLIMDAPVDHDPYVSIERRVRPCTVVSSVR